MSKKCSIPNKSKEIEREREQERARERERERKVDGKREGENTVQLMAGKERDFPWSLSWH